MRLVPRAQTALIDMSHDSQGIKVETGGTGLTENCARVADNIIVLDVLPCIAGPPGRMYPSYLITHCSSDRPAAPLLVNQSEKYTPFRYGRVRLNLLETNFRSVINHANDK